MFPRPPAAFVALAAVAGCGSEKDVIFTVAGDAPGAVELSVRVIDDDGARPKVHSAGDVAAPVKVPATIYLRISNSNRVGAVVWLADKSGTIVAQGHSARCAEMAAGGRYEVTLSPVPEGWSPATANRCRCDPRDPLGAMCPPSSSADGGSEPDASGSPAADVAAPAADVPALVDAGPDTAGDAAAASDATGDVRAADARDARDGVAIMLP
jgi:hypothetical protein